MYRLIFICLFFHIGVNSLYSQQYSIKNYGVYDGLGQSQVQTITQDSLGYLWIGTLGGGICRFDGQNFENFTKKNGLSSNFVLSIQIIDSKNIFVGTTRGLSRITPDSIYSNFTNSSLDTLTILNIQLPYISTSSGLFIYENKIIRQLDGEAKICGKEIYQTAKLKDQLWGATSHGIVEISDSKTRCRTDLNRVHNNNFTSVIKDHNDNIWVGSLGGGITKLLKSGKFINYSKRNGLETYDVSCLFEDAKNNIWIGSKGHGVTKFDGKNFIHITTKNGLANDFVNTIFEDVNGNIWFGTSNGISKYENNKYVLYDKTSYIPSGGAYSVFKALDGSLWFGIFEGGVLHSKDGTQKHYKGHNGFTSKKVKSIFQSKDSTLWFGTDGGGLYSFNHGKFKKAPLGDVWVRDIKSGKDQTTFYIATLDKGLIIINDTISEYLVEKGLSSNRINQLVVDSVIWLATDKGACYYKNDSIYKVSILPKERFTSLAKGKNGTLYFGNVGEGIYTLKNGVVDRITSKDGLNSDNIYAIYAEKDKLWVGTEKGIDEVIIDKNDKIISITKHTLKEGFLGIEIIRNSIYKDVNNTYWFGTLNGLVEHHPIQKEEQRNDFHLIMNSIELFYQPIQTNSIIGEGVVLKNHEFSYSQNHFTLRFQRINPNANTLPLYKWRLVGLDNIWNAPTSQNFATYANLPPGKYRFEVQTFSNNMWSMPISQTIFIALPFWKSFGFIFLSITIGLFFIGGIIWIVVRNIARKNKAKHERLESKRKMIELEQQALRLQMNPHFLFNSLNAIKGAVAQQQTKEAKQSIDQFAKLMRAMLENTHGGFIPLYKEINLIEQYLNLELLNHNFGYEIKLDEKVQEDCLIPAMMIQPLVENAVLHGISPLKEKGKVNIHFTLIDENILLCTIVDNGIGITASKEAQKKSVHQQSSRAMSIIISRLELIKKEDQNIGLLIEEENNENQKATIVKLKLPIKQKAK